MQERLTQTSTRTYRDHTERRPKSDRSDAVGLAERSERLQMLVGDLLRKNQELRFEVAELHNERLGTRVERVSQTWARI